MYQVRAYVGVHPDVDGDVVRFMSIVWTLPFIPKDGDSFRLHAPGLDRDLPDISSVKQCFYCPESSEFVVALHSLLWNDGDIDERIERLVSCGWKEVSIAEVESVWIDFIFELCSLT